MVTIDPTKLATTKGERGGGRDGIIVRVQILVLKTIMCQLLEHIHDLIRRYRLRSVTTSKIHEKLTSSERCQEFL